MAPLACCPGSQNVSQISSFPPYLKYILTNFLSILPHTPLHRLNVILPGPSFLTTSLCEVLYYQLASLQFWVTQHLSKLFLIKRVNASLNLQIISYCFTLPLIPHWTHSSSSPNSLLKTPWINRGTSPTFRFLLKITFCDTAHNHSTNYNLPLHQMD